MQTAGFSKMNFSEPEPLQGTSESLHDSRSPISSVACDHRMVSPISSGSGFRVAPPSDLFSHL